MSQSPVHKERSDNRMYFILISSFVRNLAFAIKTDDLKEAFEQFGDVTDCYVATDRGTGRSRYISI